MKWFSSELRFNLITRLEKLYSIEILWKTIKIIIRYSKDTNDQDTSWIIEDFLSKSKDSKDSNQNQGGEGSIGIEEVKVKSKSSVYRSG